jgi:gamma-glutamyl-gamma-aminobutyrate hydrolase PuuD
MLNVWAKGGLIADIESAGYTHHRTGDVVQRLHAIEIEERSLLHSIAGVTTGEVNTFHHQAVQEPGQRIRVTARSHDGVVEAIELLEPASAPLFLGVQWHPERFKDARSPFGAGVRDRFLSEC